MEKKIILVIGASSGIGKFISTMLVRDNNIVINADITNSIASNWTIDSHIYEVHLDVTSNDQIIDLAKNISTKFGVLDTLIYAPAPPRSNRKSFPDNLDTVDSELNILLKGAMSCIRFFYPLMLES
jgi:NAD(P)-dependent dehydrogenase (short-subunit alcohol dehydrogenase family)